MTANPIVELAEFLAMSTPLGEIDPSAAGPIARRLYEAGWRKSGPDHSLAWLNRHSLRFQAGCACGTWRGRVQLMERDARLEHEAHAAGRFNSGGGEQR
jgi:hypothetical protein